MRQDNGAIVVPHCELVAKWMKEDQQVKSLEHRVKILGTMDDDDFFAINIHPKAGMHTSMG